MNEQVGEAREHLIQAADGRPLAATTFTGPQDRIVVIAGATGAPRRIYADLARAVVAHGATAITFDYRGTGDSVSGHPRRDPARMRDWGLLDIEGILRHVEGLAPSAVRWIGQSAGGSFLPLAPSRHLVDRLATVSVISGYWGLMAAGERLRLGVAWHTFFPLARRVLGYGPGWLWGGEPLPPAVFREWGLWCRMPGFFFDDPTLDTSGFADVTAPILAVRATDDPWATEASHRALHERFSAASVMYRNVTPSGLGVRRIGHIGLLRGKVGSAWWPELLSWLLDD